MVERGEMGLGSPTPPYPCPGRSVCVVRERTLPARDPRSWEINTEEDSYRF